MKITKLGHCCLLVEVNGLRILTDPGTYSEQQNSLTDVDIVLITHEHPDHFHVESVKKIISNNPSVRIITNSAVGKLLEQDEIEFQILEKGSAELQGVIFEAFGEKHAYMYSTIPPVQNTGYFIDNKLFYPGDALTNPNKPVEVLALPVAGPWMKLSEAIDYALEVKPSKCFPVHDGIMKIVGGVIHKLPETVLKSAGIEFVVIDLDHSLEF